MTEITGATAEQEAMLREILAGLPGDHLDRIAVEMPAAEWGAASGDVALRVDYPEAVRGRGNWEGGLVVGAFHDLSEERGLPRVVALLSPQVGVGLDRMRRPGLHPSHERDSVVLEAIIRRAAGIELEKLEILKPYGYAAATRIRPAEPHGFLRHRLTFFLHGTTHHMGLWDGLYLEVVDAGAEPIYFTGVSRGIGGGTYVRPDFACCVRQRGPRLAHPAPPCPVFGDPAA